MALSREQVEKWSHPDVHQSLAALRDEVLDLIDAAEAAEVAHEAAAGVLDLQVKLDNADREHADLVAVAEGLEAEIESLKASIELLKAPK